MPMEGSRRGSRSGMDPIVRRVGFVTPGTESEPPVRQTAPTGPGQSSPAPVIIPPRPINLSSAIAQEIATSKPAPALKTITTEVFPPAFGRQSEELSVSASLPGSNMSMGSAVADAYTEAPASVSTVVSTMRQMSMSSASVPSGGFVKAANHGATAASVSGKDAAVFVKPTDLGKDVAVPVKEKPKTRAERRALQEAQRAAKPSGQGGKAPGSKGGASEKGAAKAAESKKPTQVRRWLLCPYRTWRRSQLKMLCPVQDLQNCEEYSIYIFLWKNICAMVQSRFVPALQKSEPLSVHVVNIHNGSGEAYI
jgi:hypothetical protein